MNKISVLIPDGESPFAFHVLACLSQNNRIEAHIISKTSHPLTRFSRFKKSFHLVQENQSLLDAVTKVCSQIHIDICMPVDTEGIYYFSKNIEALQSFSTLSLIHSAEKIREVWDKGTLANFLSKKQLPHPLTITNQEEFSEKINSFSFPVLIKPRLLGGGDQIAKFNNLEELSERMKHDNNFFDTYIIQQFVEGEDIDCSVLCENGNILAYTIQRDLSPVASSYQPAEAIEFVHNPQVLALTSELMSALKWNGVAHVDLRIQKSDKKILIIEINPRFWGSIEGSLKAGVNFPYLTCLASIREKFQLPEYKDGRYMSALSNLKHFLQKKPTVNLFHETNFPYYLRDPLPVLARFVKNK